MDGTNQLVWGMFFGAIGLGFFTYGKRQKALIPLLVGVALFIYPYFVTNEYALVGIGVALVATPNFVRV